MRSPAGNLLFCAALACATLPVVAGCHSACQVGDLAKCGPFSPAWELVQVGDSADSTALAEQAFSQAEEARRRDDPQSPDLFYQAALHSWCGLGQPDASSTAWRIYHQSVAGLIAEGQQHGRFTGRGELVVQQAGKKLAIPLVCLGLPWEPADVSELQIAERPRKPKLLHYHTAEGLGVPLLALRIASNRPRLSEPFLPHKLPFAATAVLRPSDGDGGAVLELYNPLQAGTAGLHGRAVPLASDLSAPLEYAKQSDEQGALLGFIDPGHAEYEGLRFLEPYQAGKIPVVFVHGLLSDPTTWCDVANELRTQAWFNEHYQIWLFRYATGKPFLTSAMLLRTQTRDALARLDPHCEDPALRRMVLVGHSMGGLVAKLQVTHSEERIWGSFANAPLESLRASPRAKAELAERCYFDPQPAYRRVVFIATPHGGSSWAVRGLGRISSALVEPTPQFKALHDQLVADNPGVFSSLFQKRVPTSIDLLEPHDPTLQAIRTLRMAPGVTLHTILGTGRPSVTEGAGDGVVSVDDARHPRVVSERYVDARHMSMLRHPDTIAEIQYILREHLGASVR